MTDARKEWSIKALRLALGIVVLIESIMVAYNYKATVAANHIGLPGRVILVLALIEILGAVLFLIKPTIRFGSYVLLAVFGCAAIIHILHSQYDVGGLVVYGAAVVAVWFHITGSNDDGRRIDTEI
jgi:hypothetical protein